MEGCQSQRQAVSLLHVSELPHSSWLDLCRLPPAAVGHVTMTCSVVVLLSMCRCYIWQHEVWAGATAFGVCAKSLANAALFCSVPARHYGCSLCNTK